MLKKVILLEMRVVQPRRSSYFFCFRGLCCPPRPAATGLHEVTEEGVETYTHNHSRKLQGLPIIIALFRKSTPIIIANIGIFLKPTHNHSAFSNFDPIIIANVSISALNFSKFDKNHEIQTHNHSKITNFRFCIPIIIAENR